MKYSKKKFFDRQIQLLGDNSQEKINNTTILIYRITSTSTEIMKNLILTGFNLKIFEDRNIKKEDLENNPLINHNDLDKIEKNVKIVDIIEKKLLSLNPFCKIDVFFEKELFEKNIESEIFIVNSKDFDDFEYIKKILSKKNNLTYFIFQNDLSFIFFLELKDQKISGNFFEEMKKLDTNFVVKDFNNNFQKKELNVYNKLEGNLMFINGICGCLINQSILSYIMNDKLRYNLLTINLGQFLNNPIDLNKTKSYYITTIEKENK